MSLAAGDWTAIPSATWRSRLRAALGEYVRDGRRLYLVELRGDRGYGGALGVLARRLEWARRIRRELGYRVVVVCASGVLIDTSSYWGDRSTEEGSFRKRHHASCAARRRAQAAEYAERIRELASGVAIITRSGAARPGRSTWRSEREESDPTSRPGLAVVDAAVRQAVEAEFERMASWSEDWVVAAGGSGKRGGGRRPSGLVRVEAGGEQ